ncbi:MAG: ferredoxin, partial [Rhodospirillaceae bacterium]|nr:ferredoxin [Rhodospirillaceae bacterium]
MARPDWTRRIEGPLAGSGLFLRGAFHPTPEDAVPPLADGRAAGTVALIGNAGNDLWRAFRASCPDMAVRHPLDSWVAGYLRAAAEALGAELVDAMRPPWPPIQQWAARAGAGHRSPINLVIHPEYGLWHT